MGHKEKVSQEILRLGNMVTGLVYWEGAGFKNNVFKNAQWHWKHTHTHTQHFLSWQYNDTFQISCQQVERYLSVQTATVCHRAGRVPGTLCPASRVRSWAVQPVPRYCLAGVFLCLLFQGRLRVTMRTSSVVCAWRPRLWPWPRPRPRGGLVIQNSLGIDELEDTWKKERVALRVTKFLHYRYF